MNLAANFVQEALINNDNSLSEELTAHARGLFLKGWEFGFPTSLTLREVLLGVDQFSNHLRNQLDGIKDECQETNWDFHHAAPIEPEAIKQAKKLIFELERLSKKMVFPPPEISPSPDGRILFDWLWNDQRLLLAPHPDKTLSYVFLGAGSKRLKGSHEFHETLSPLLISIISLFHLGKL